MLLPIVPIKAIAVIRAKILSHGFQVSFPKRLRTASAAVNYGYGLKVALVMHFSARV
jgi:hypothetical protein